MNKNPLVLLDSLLEDWVSPRVRRSIHTLLLLASVIVGMVLASGGDWREFLVALGAVLYAWSNRANTRTNEDDLS